MELSCEYLKKNEVFISFLTTSQRNVTIWNVSV